MEGSQKIVADFLDKRESFIQSELKQCHGRETARRYAELMDRFVRSLFLEAGFTEHSSGEDGGLTVMALGGYGREELCLHSDVDLMVIHQGKLSREMTDVISRAIYPLWDAKLEVGHSVLTYRECIRLAVTDFRVFTSLLDSRFLLGSRSFYDLFREAFWSRIHREKPSLLGKFLVSRGERAEKYGGEDHFVEPDLKEGLGGLRDLHLMDWMAKTYFRCRRIDEIERFAVFSHFDLDQLAVSRSFLLTVRNHLHLLANRKEDRLFLTFQNRISRDMGYDDGEGISGPEKLMRDLYLHLNRIRYRHEEFQAKALDMIEPSPAEPTPDQLPDEFQVVKGNIVLKEGSLFEKDPLVILRALNEANRRGLFLGSGFIWEAEEIIGRGGNGLADAPEGKQLFLELILRPQNPKIIRLALEIGLITLFIPEFTEIRNLPQFGFYHVMTVDLHSLRALEVMNEISQGVYDAQWPLLKKVFDRIEHPDWLFLAALLHDIGKGNETDHAKKGSALIVTILKRLGVTGPAIDVIPFLVRHHLLLVNVSQRRDLSDEKTSVHVAQIIQDKNLFKMLFLLTVADSFATGPMARSDWKIMLLTELFMKVRRILERGLLASPDATKKIAARKRSLLAALRPAFSEEDVLNLMDQVSSRYFLSATPEDMIQHFRMALTLGSERHAWVLQRVADAPVTRIIQCTYDKPGLFSKMVGVFTLNNIEILSANIFTLKNGLAFDIYEVTNPLDRYREAERWEKTLNDVRQVLEDRLPLDDLIREKGRSLYSQEYQTPVQTKVTVDNEASDFFTVIEISSPISVGLAYTLAKRMSSVGLDIRFAKVNSDEEMLRGVFYVKDSGGQKIFEADKIARIRDELMAAGAGT
ncbi:MAG: [protein-PII] uridylyltransferase [Deltaproteobacteria bacterium]|nr:[protein-PII] uridylyltransferase [Deltaproteobacteria bacterium]